MRTPLALALALALLPRGAHAQQDLPPAWSAFAHGTELPQRLLAAPASPALLVLPPPRIGLHWSAGNPAGLAFEPRGDWTQFAATHSAESGDYRRPLEAEDVGATSLGAGGWRTLGSGNVSGTLTVARIAFNDMPSNVGDAYTGSPHFSGDSVAGELRATAVRLEGAGGWRMGAWGAGVAAGYETENTRTEQSPVPRFRRGGTAAVTVGFARALRDGALVLGVYGRGQSESRRVSASAQLGAVGRVFPLEGYGEPVPVDLTEGQAFNRRTRRDAIGYGVTASARALGATWAAWGGKSALTERQTRITMRDAPADTWEPDGMNAGLAAQRYLAADRGLLTATVHWQQAEGTATRSAIEAEGVVFRTDEQLIAADVELRWRWDTGWQAAAHGTVRRSDRERRDLLSGVGYDLAAWQPGIALEAARTFERLAVSAGAAAAFYGASGEIPNGTSLGPLYQKLLAPEMAVYGTSARLWQGTLAARYRVRPAREVWFRTSYGSSAPQVAGVLLRSEDERRNAWTVMVGLDLLGQ